MNKLKRSGALFVALIMLFTFALSACDPEQILQDIASEFIEVVIEYPSGELLSESTDNEPMYTYSIKASVGNSYIFPMVDAVIKLNVPDNVEVTDLGDDAEINLPLLEQDMMAECEWIVKIPMTNADQNLEYNVSVESEVSSLIETFGMLYVPGINPGDKRLSFSTDTWKFDNYGEIPIPLTQDDYNSLMMGLSNAYKEYFKDEISKKAGGYCYGMAATSILTKVGRLDPDDYSDKDVNSLHDLKKTKQTKSLLGFYWMTQKLPEIIDERTEFIAKSTELKLSIIEGKAKNVEHGGNPFILSFYSEANQTGGHAVVGYSHENGSFEWNDHTYDSRILVYDSNEPKWDVKSCLYYNAGTADWYIPNYPNASGITRALSDIGLMDIKNIEMGKKSVNSYITARESLNLNIYNEDGALIGSVNGANVTSGKNITAFLEDGSDDLTIAVMPASETEKEKPALTVRPEVSGSPLDLDIMYDDFYLSASTQSGNGVKFNPEGVVGFEGNATDFEIEVTANEGFYTTDWYKVSVTGDSANNPEIAVDDKGYLLYGDNMEGIVVRAENDSSAKEMKVKTDEDYVLIAQQGDKLCAMTDSDKDGVYETVVAKGKDAKLNGTGGAGINWSLILIIIGAVLALAIIVVAVILIVKKMKNKKPKSTTSFDDINKSDNNGMFL